MKQVIANHHLSKSIPRKVRVASTSSPQNLLSSLFIFYFYNRLLFSLIMLYWNPISYEFLGIQFHPTKGPMFPENMNAYCGILFDLAWEYVWLTWVFSLHEWQNCSIEQTAHIRGLTVHSGWPMHTGSSGSKEHIYANYSSFLLNMNCCHNLVTVSLFAIN